MKQIIAVFFSLIVFCGAVQCIYTLESRQLHQEELELAVENAMYHSLSMAGIKKTYTIHNDQELYADFLGELMLLLGAEAEYNVKVYELNIQKGIMDVEVISSFSVWGEEKNTVSCRKYAVLEQI